MLLASVSLLALAVSNVSEGTGDNVNEAEFGIFCTLLNTLDAEDIENVATEGLDQKANTAYTEIEHMFIMTSNESYYNEGPANSPDSTGTIKPKTEADISQWKNERKVWEETPYPGDPSKKKYTRKDRSLLPKQLGDKLDRSFARATKIKSEIQSTAQAIEQKEKEIRTALRQALCGWHRPGDATPKPKPVAADFENTYAAACYGTSGPGKRLANDLVCLCSASASTSTENNKQCTDNTILTDTTNYGTSATALTRFTTLQQACKKVYQTYKVSAAALKGLTTAFMARLGHHSLSSASDLGSYTYGKGQDSTNACNGGAADGKSCVNYATLVKASSGTALDKAVAWLKEIGAAETAVLARFTLIKKKQSKRG
uniref:Variant surface glycoprotein 1539 n=1 Tax=Trypanosoma brucei TaxID=5691 RepID=M4TBV5_9TRYP|nr:variant surface glycoprotein 1539 [Trypanosoma brucei]